MAAMVSLRRSEMQASAERRHCAPNTLELHPRPGERDGAEQATDDGIELAYKAETRVCEPGMGTGDYYAAEIIHFAAQDGLVDVVESQLDAGVDPDLATAARGWTALHYASYNGRADVVDLLLARDATPECRSLSNRTPLMLARLGNHDEVATMLADAVCKTARCSPVWVRSWEATSCMRCATPFSFFLPKHHCRRCGCTVCGSCSRGTLILDQWLAPVKPHELRKTVSEMPQRVCDGCLKYHTQELPDSDVKDNQHESLAVVADGPHLLSRGELQLLRALALWNPSLVGWASIKASDGTELLELQAAPDRRDYAGGDCVKGCGFGCVYKVVSDARVRASCDIDSKLVGVLRAGQKFTSLETRVTGCGRTRVSVPLTSSSVQTDHRAMDESILAHKYVRAHSAYNASDAYKHSLAVGDILLVTENLRNGWSAGFKLDDNAQTTLLFPISHTKSVKLKLSTPERDSEAESEDEQTSDDEN